MTWVGTAIVGGSVISGVMGMEAAGSQERSAERAAEASTAEQRRQFDLQRADTAPYRQAGVNALSTLQQQLAGPQGGEPPPAFTYAGEQPQFQGGERFQFDLQADPGYQFARDEAIKAANRQMAAGGGYGSGNRLAEIADRVTGVASQYADQAFRRQLAGSAENYGRGVQEYGFDVAREAGQYGRGLTGYGLEAQREQDIYGRGQNYLNRLAALAGTGQTAVGQSGAAGSNMANALANINAARAAAQGQAAGTQYGAANQAIQGGLSNYLLYQNLQGPGQVAGDAYQPAMSYGGY
jgi:hypothetical protein